MRACVLACSKIKLYVKVIYNLQRVYKHYMINRTNFRVPGPLSKLKRRLDSLEATQGAPRDPGRDSRGERSLGLQGYPTSQS